MKRAIKMMAVALIAGAIMLITAGIALADATVNNITVSPLAMDDMNKQDIRLTNTNTEAVTVQWRYAGGASSSWSASIALEPDAYTTVTAPESIATSLAIMVRLEGVQGQKTISSTNLYYVTQYFKCGTVDIIPPVKTQARATAASNQALNPPATIEKGGKTYKYQSASNGNSVAVGAYSGSREYIFYYTEVVPQPYYITVKMYDVVTKDEINEKQVYVDVNQSVTYTALKSFTGSNGKTYRLCNGQPATLVHDYSNQRVTTYALYYDKMPDPRTSAYSITVRYINDDNGQILASNKVEVPLNQDITFQVAQSYTDGNYNRYDRVAGESSVINHDFIEPTLVYTVLFTPNNQRPTTPYTVTINYKDALTGDVLYSEDQTMQVDGSIVHSAPATYSANGQRYIVASGQNRNVRLSFLDNVRVQDIYYNNESATPVDPYDITVRYVDGTTNAVLFSTTLNVPVRGSVTHIAPVSYTAGGVEYVLGSWVSSNTLTHDYDSTRRVYTVFYRDTAIEEEEPAPGPGPGPGPDAGPDGGDAIIPDQDDALNGAFDNDDNFLENPDALADGDENTGDNGDDDAILDDSDDALTDGSGTPAPNKSVSPWLWLLALIPVAGVGLALGLRAKKTRG